LPLNLYRTVQFHRTGPAVSWFSLRTLRLCGNLPGRLRFSPAVPPFSLRKSFAFRSASMLLPLSAIISAHLW
jgi:hypothetical protein